MSEFSESYHLRSERVEDAVELLKRVKRKGFAFQPVGGWVTFVAEGGNFEPDKKIVAAAQQPLLHFVSAEDHGWSFALYDRAKVVSAYACEWENDVSSDDSEYSRDDIERLVPSAHAPSLDEFERQMNPQDIDELLRGSPSTVLAEALGLEHFDWLSYDSLAGDFEESPDDFPDVIEVA